jgi:predicted ester cyclase
MSLAKLMLNWRVKMSVMAGVAKAFLDTCETGKGWNACKEYCHEGATFSAQADALTGVDTVEAYAEWMRGLFSPIPDGRYELKAFAADPERNSVLAFAVFHGTHTGEGGPVPPTGKSVAAEYVYAMDFDGDRIRHITKIWNDAFTMRQAGWVPD